MGLVLGKLWSSLFGRSHYKICMVGLDCAGKTTVLYKLNLGETIETTPTLGSNVESVTHNNVEFQVWDLGGQESIRQVWQTYFINSHAIILVIDSSDVQRLPLVKNELQRILQMDELKGLPILCLANKQDVQGALKASEVATGIGLNNIKSHPWHIQSCSAIKGTGLTEGLDWLEKTIAGAKG